MAESNFELHQLLSDKERRKSLQQLDGQDWGDVSFPSHLVLTSHALRRKPLRDFTIEDLRIMIGQNIGLAYLVPLALERLQDDPLVAGDLYDGDLLANVLKIEPGFWLKRPDLRREIEEIIAKLDPFPKILHHALLVFRQLPVFGYNEENCSLL